MARSEQFHLGFLSIDADYDEMFISVTPGFEYGPGIQRDGITTPRMTDPHSVARIRNFFGLPGGTGPSPTTDPYLQRTGTWTIYHHIKKFIEKMGTDWEIIGVQSNGDLTMNFWHTAYLRKSYIENQEKILCALKTDGDPQEPISSRNYHSLVKWGDEAKKIRGRRYECLDLRIEYGINSPVLLINDLFLSEELHNSFSQLDAYNKATRDIAPLVKFTLSGKPIVENGIELSLINAIDRFEDVRHIFNLCEIDAKGFYNKQVINKLIFGEYQLFGNLNVRRAALSSPVIINLDLTTVYATWETVKGALIKRHFKEVFESPARRGQFRKYIDQANQQQVEIFFPHNVYPFGVLGLQEPQGDKAEGIVCLSSGGLSGRVGNTLEGTTRIMYDFFGCSNAMVLDEGMDVFFIANTDEKGNCEYPNETLLNKVLAFTKKVMDRDHKESIKYAERRYDKPPIQGLKDYRLNIDIFEEIEKDYKKLTDEIEDGTRERSDLNYEDILLVEPGRTQIRSVIIFARKKTKTEKLNHKSKAPNSIKDSTVI